MLHVVAALMLGCLAQPGPTNLGFEEGLDGWTVHIFGAEPEIGFDQAVRHEGSQSLRISSGKPTDTALGQNLLLKPNRTYRLTGWVRTAGLDRAAGRVSGTFQIQRHDSTVIASGDSHWGNTDWVRVSVPFRAPADGKTRIAVFFVGYGQGTGAAWFDELKLEEIEMSGSTITVTTDPLVNARIHRYQYGQFIEYLCDLVPGLWAERLDDGSFEGLSPYRFLHIQETDFREHPWFATGATNRAEFLRDESTRVTGTKSMKVATEEGAPCSVGVRQNGVYVRKGEVLRFSVFLRSTELKKTVRVSLDHSGQELVGANLEASRDWRKHSVELRPNQTVADASIALTFKSPGAVWFDNAHLMPSDTVGGWRRDAVEAIRALKPGIIRTGGSVLEEPSYGDFDWRYTVGDPDRRTPFRSWGGLQPTGPGLGEFIELCREVGAEPLMCVPFSRKKPSDAAEMVEYFNGPVSTPMGAKRAADGHPEPYGIRYWQVGNERFGKEYDEGLAAFCTAMLAVDPTIRLLSNEPTPASIANAGSMLSYVCPHHYGCDNLGACQGSFDAIRRMVAENAPGRDIRVAVTEWNTTAGDAGPKRAKLWTLENALACARYHNLLHRNADLVDISCRSNLCNSFCSGIIQTDNHRLYVTPTYHAQWLYSNLAGDVPLSVRTELGDDPSLDVSATLDSDGRFLTVFVVNDGLDEAVRRLDLGAFSGGGLSLDTWTLADLEKAGEPDVTNSFDDPGRVAPVKKARRFGAPRFEYRFPHLSLTVIRLALDPKGLAQPNR